MAAFNNARAELFGGRTKSPGSTNALGATPSDTVPRTLSSGGRTAGATKSPGGKLPPTEQVLSGKAQMERLKEAEQMRKAAGKNMQKTLTQWKPNYFAAAPLFEKAANCYRSAGSDQLAISMFTSAAECQTQNDAHASAAKDFKEAANIALRAERELQAAELYQKCAECWVNGNEAGKAGEYLCKAAKILELFDEEKAAEAYWLAVDTMVPADATPSTDFIRILGASDTFTMASSFLLGIKKYKEALKVLDRHVVFLQSEKSQHSLGKAFLTQTILHLAMGDYVKANQVFGEEHLQSTEYLSSQECKLEESFLTAYKNYDAKALEDCVNDRLLTRLDPAVCRLAKSLFIDGLDLEEEVTAQATPWGKSASAFSTNVGGPSAGGVGGVKARLAAMSAGRSPRAGCSPRQASTKATPPTSPGGTTPAPAAPPVAEVAEEEAPAQQDQVPVAKAVSSPGGKAAPPPDWSREEAALFSGATGTGTPLKPKKPASPATKSANPFAPENSAPAPKSLSNPFAPAGQSQPPAWVAGAGGGSKRDSLDLSDLEATLDHHDSGDIDLDAAIADAQREAYEMAKRGSVAEASLGLDGVEVDLDGLLDDTDGPPADDDDEFDLT